MKNIFLFLSLTLLFSCQSFEKEKLAINELAISWDSLTASTNGFSEMLNSANAEFTEKIASVSIDSAGLAALPQEQQSNIAAAKNSFMEVGTELATLTDSFGELLEQYNAKSDQVMNLKELTQSESFGDSTLTEVIEIKDFVNDAGQNLGQLKVALESTKSKLASTYSDLSALLTSSI